MPGRGHGCTLMSAIMSIPRHSVWRTRRRSFWRSRHVFLCHWQKDNAETAHQTGIQQVLSGTAVRFHEADMGK